MVNAMGEKIVLLAIKIVVVAPHSHTVAMVSAMAQKIAIHVVLTVDLVIHGRLAVEMGNAMGEKIVCLVHQIVVLVIHIRIAVVMEHATVMKQHGPVLKIVVLPIIAGMVTACPIWARTL